MLRAHSLNSTVDVSRHGLFRLVKGKKINNKICPHVHIGGKKKLKANFKNFIDFSVFLARFCLKKCMISGQLHGMSEEKIK